MPRSKKEERAAHKFDRKIVAEEDWLRYGVTARRKRNQKRLESLVSMRDRAARSACDPSAMSSSRPREAEISGKLVIEAKDIGKSFGEPVIVKNFSIRISRGDRLGSDRRQWRGQDDAHQSLDRRACRRIGARSGTAPIFQWRRSTRAARALIRTDR